MSVTQSIKTYLSRHKKGEPFGIDSLYRFGEKATVQKAVSRLVKEGELISVARGIYMRPKPLALNPKKSVKASPSKVAKVWAKQHGRKLVEQPQEAAYWLGFQTQAPMSKIFWSDSSNKEFSVGNAKAVIRKVSTSKLKWANKPEGVFLRGMMAVPASNVSGEHIKNAFKRLNVKTSEAKVKILETVKKSHEVSSDWKRLIDDVEKEFRA